MTTIAAEEISKKKEKKATPTCAATADSHYVPEGNQGSINHQVDGKTTASISTYITRFFAHLANI